MKNALIIALLTGTLNLFAQLGVGTTNPKNTLDVHKSAADVSSSGNSSNGHFRIGGSLGTSVLDLGISNSSESAWLQSRRSDNYSTTQSLRLQPNGGRVGIGITTAPTEMLHVAGNLKSSGYVRGTATGQVLNQIFLNASDLGFSSALTVTNTSLTDVISYSYTPVSTSSRIWIKFDCASVVYGSATSGSDDECESIITVTSGSTSSTLQMKRQYYGQVAGAGARKSMLFPISGVYNQSGGTALTFKVQARRVVGDDGVNILPDMVLSILEVAQ